MTPDGDAVAPRASAGTRADHERRRVYREIVRSLVDFYRRNPLVLAVAVVIGAVISALAASGRSNGIVADVAAVAVAGLLVGLAIAWHRNRDA